MATRAFTVFIDEPTVAPSKPIPRSTSRSTTPLLSPGGSCITLPDKENTHPITGARASLVGLGGKTLKRKTGVLETKLYVPPATKKSKDAAKAGLGVKRGASAPPEIAAPPSPTRKTKKKTTSMSAGSTSSASTAKAKRTSTRKASSKRVAELPPVHEEPETSSVPAPSPLLASQAEIDSRCYDLTVSPLADVSEAYESIADKKASSQLEVLRVPKKTRTKNRMVDTDIRDYFDESQTIAPRKFTRSVSLPVEAFSHHISSLTRTSPVSSTVDSIIALSESASQSTVASFTSTSSTSTLVSPSQSPLSISKGKALEFTTDIASLNTPERKQVYAAFTFASPSPSADRFRHTRSTSVDRFGDIAFNPLA